MSKQRGGRRRDGDRRQKTKGAGTYWYDQKSGRHFYRIAIDGKRYTVADTDPARAKARFDGLKAKLAARVNIDAGRQTLNEFAAYYLETVIVDDVGFSTRRNYAQRYTYYIGPTLGEYQLAALTPPLILAWRNAINKAFALSSVRQALSLLQRILDHALVERAIDTNPAAQIRPPRFSAKPKGDDEDESDDLGIALEQHQVEALLRMARTWPTVTTKRGKKPQRVASWMELDLLYLLAVRLGLRRGEVLGVRWKDVDWDARTVTIAQQVQYLGGPLQMNEPKTDAGKRVVPLPDELLAALRAYALRTGRRDGLIFATRRGGPISPRNLVRHFKRLIERVNEEEQEAAQKEGREAVEVIPADLRFHDLRVTAVTRWRKLGVDFEVIASIVGHSSPQVTADVYTKVDDARRREAIERTG